MSEYVYILFDKPENNLIIGETSNLLMHMHELKNKTNDIDKDEYPTNKLAYYERFEEFSDAIIRKNELEQLPKEDLLQLIKSDNPDLSDLHEKILKIWNDEGKLHDKEQIKSKKGENI